MVTFDQFLQQACPPLDLQWRKYRRRSARHRVGDRLRALGIQSYADYLGLLHFDPQEAALFPDLMRVTVSRFFREEKQWRELKDYILPALMPDSDAGHLRAWSAGCCGGEEPFTLALIWLEYTLSRHPPKSMEILATDIDDASLERAGRALYRRETLREIPSPIRERWFSPAHGQWRLDEQARSLVRFEKSNLITDPPPTGMDLALCRYLAFTYFKGNRLQAAVGNLWKSLRPGGVLMIGVKEELHAPALEFFEPLQGSPVFYRRKG